MLIFDGTADAGLDAALLLVGDRVVRAPSPPAAESVCLVGAREVIAVVPFYSGKCIAKTSWWPQTSA